MDPTSIDVKLRSWFLSNETTSSTSASGVETLNSMSVPPRIMIIHIIVHHYVPGFWLTWKLILRISDLLVSWARSPGSLLIFRGRHQIHRPLPLWRHKRWRVSLINTTPGAFTLQPHQKEVRGSFHSTDLLIKDCSHLFSLFWSWGGWGHQAHCWTLISVSLFPSLVMFG